MKILIILIISILSFSSFGFPIPKDNKVTFDMIRKNKVIGSVESTFTQTDEILTIKTFVNIKIKVLFIQAYKFTQTTTETWVGDEFIKFDGHTDFEDEREYFIKGEVKDDFLFASGMDGELKLDKNLIPSNFWNIDVMYQDEIFDTQKGIVRKLSIKQVDNEIITINNTKIDCTKFILNATRHPKDKDLFPEYTLWYSKDKELMKFKFRSTKNKKIIEIIRKL